MKRRKRKREAEPRDDVVADEAAPVSDAGYVTASAAIAAFMGAPPVDPGRYGAEAGEPGSDPA
jgi:hypothetical protein